MKGDLRLEEEKRKPMTEQEADGGSEQSRREFITKLVTTAGAVAAVGLVAGAAEENAQGASYLKLDKWHGNTDGAATFKFLKNVRGFRITMTGKQLGDAMKQAGLLQDDANPDNAQITIEFTS
jgi:hypothetical protein